MKERERESKQIPGKEKVRLTRKDGRESKERKGERMRKKLKRRRNSGKKVSRREEREREVFWKVESKDDVEGGQQEKRNVVENVMKLVERERERKGRRKEESVREKWSKEEKVMSRRVTRT